MHPSTFGSCTVTAVLATGPLANVFKATQAPLDRPVALKALKETISPGSPFAGALEREATLLATLRHDTIPRLLEFNRTDDAMWIVMELCDGFTLREVMKACGRLDPAAATAIAIELARALAHCHSRGIIHCEVCPSNILVSRDGEVKLVDFGKAQAEQSPASSPEPVEGAPTMGTPAYLSPEQILGEAIDARSDLFSLGIVLYEMLAGARPFEDQDDRTVAHRIRHEDPPRLDTVQRDVPRGLPRVVANCLQKLAADRPGSAQELRTMLEEVYGAVSAKPRREEIAAALARAKLIERVVPGDSDPQEPLGARQASASLGPALRMLGVMSGLVVLGAVVIHVAFHTEMEATSPINKGALELAPQQAGYLRVLARPWAHVIVDGQQVETTPFARPIPLAAGVHQITLRHPQAADERRIVKVSPGERVVLDVTMQLKQQPKPDASAPPPAPTPSTP